MCTPARSVGAANSNSIISLFSVAFLSIAYISCGNSTFGSAVFGTSKDPMFRQAIEGSGNVTNFKISTSDTNPTYAINVLYIDYVPSGRR